jgi:hypothetical protein
MRCGVLSRRRPAPLHRHGRSGLGIHACGRPQAQARVGAAFRTQDAGLVERRICGGVFDAASTGREILLGAVPRGEGLAPVAAEVVAALARAAAGQASPECHGKSRAGMFYAESWLLTHMLSRCDDYRGGFPKFCCHDLRNAIRGRAAFAGLWEEVAGNSGGNARRSPERFLERRSMQDAFSESPCGACGARPRRGSRRDELEGLPGPRPAAGLGSGCGRRADGSAADDAHPQADLIDVRLMFGLELYRKRS